MLKYLRLPIKIIFVLLLSCCAARSSAQFIITGTVYDSSKVNLVEGVKVVSTSGVFAMTDTMGRYTIRVNENDSLSFIYNNKPTQKFVVADIPDPSRFDISLHVRVKSKYTTLKEVLVRAKSYKEDSMENRKEYADIFEFKKPTIRTGIDPSGVVGMDVNELINIFRFKRTKRIKAFQKRLEWQEQEKYITYRFNRLLVRRITGLEGVELDSFLVKYRPNYDLVKDADETTMNQYILKCLYQYKIELLNKDAAK